MTAELDQPRELAALLQLEREWLPDRQAMLAALRVVLAMPPKPVRFAKGGAE